MATSTTAILTPEQSMAALKALLNGPAEPPPPGVTSNFINPPNLHPVGIITLTLCLVFSALAVLMRMYTKFFLIRSIAPEDYIVVIAWVGQIAEAIPTALTFRYGVSVHMWNVQLKDFFKLLEYFNLGGILYCPAIFFVKLSILLQYLRIFVPTRRGNMMMLVGVQVCIWSCFIYYLVSAIFLIVMCKPREKIWNPLIAGHCFNIDASYQATGIFNLVSDFAILILPIPSIWKLQLPLKRKLGLIAIFATGFFACVTSIARVYYSWKFRGSPDISYNVTGLGLWTWAEIATGLIVSCLPVLPKFFQHISPKLHRLPTFGWKSRSTFRHTPGSSGVTSTTLVSSNHERPHSKSGGVDSTSVTWNDLYDPRAQLRAEYITLEEFDKISSKGDISERQASGLSGVPTPHAGGEV